MYEYEIKRNQNRRFKLYCDDSMDVVYINIKTFFRNLFGAISNRLGKRRRYLLSYEISKTRMSRNECEFNKYLRYNY